MTQNSKTNPYQKANQNSSILKALAMGAGAYLLGNQIERRVVNKNRAKTALEEFDQQDLSSWDRERLKTAFKAHDFYVTKFPQTSKQIFPLAAQILYKLFQFHGQKRMDSHLAMEILQDCEKLHQMGKKYHIYPINLNWPYWILVTDSRKSNLTIFKHSSQYRFVQRPTWNLQTFLMGDEELEETLEWIDQGDKLSDISQLSKFPGIVKAGLFGIDASKKIDFCYYRKTWLGKLVDRREVDENEKTLATVWNFIQDSQYVAVIYDLKFGFGYQGEETFDGTITDVTSIRDGQVFTQRDIESGRIRIYRNVEVSRAQFISPNWVQIQDQISWGSLMDDGSRDDSKPYVYFDEDGLPAGLSVNVNPYNCPRQAGRYYKTIRISSFPKNLVIVQSTADGDRGHLVIWPTNKEPEKIANNIIASSMDHPQITKKKYYNDRLSKMGYKNQTNPKW